MKTIILLFAAITVAMFTGCDNTPKNNDSNPAMSPGSGGVTTNSPASTNSSN